VEQNIFSEWDKYLEAGWPMTEKVPFDYKGPKLPDLITVDAMLDLLKHFAKRANDPSLPRLHSKYVFLILVKFFTHAKGLPNIMQVSTQIPRRITIIGDLHGQLRDLCEIFRLNGQPSADNPYLFNGDLVDRGEHSLEIALIVLGLAAANPSAVRVNRGNHEDMSVCNRYGFADEILRKYDGLEERNGRIMLSLFEEVFSLLPLMTIIDNDVLVTHGGISEAVNLAAVADIDRHAYKHVRPLGDIDDKDYAAVAALLWSDPRDMRDGMVFSGCSFNKKRGIGMLWGSDVSASWLEENQLALIIRSHECKDEGYQILHDGRVMTLFSASSYYEEGTNAGAYCVLHRDHGATLQQFRTDRYMQFKAPKFSKSASKMEAVAAEQLHHLLIAHKNQLTKRFAEKDPTGSGELSPTVWASIVEQVTDVKVPWVTMRGALVKTASDGRSVLWRSCLECQSLPPTSDFIINGLYKGLQEMEAVFRLIDKDGTGRISTQELEQAAKILSDVHGGCEVISASELHLLAESMDTDGNGSISYTEFLESMRNGGLA